MLRFSQRLTLAALAFSLVTLGAAERVSAAWMTYANVATDYQAAAAGETSQSINTNAGIPDTIGSGSWDYLKANSPGVTESLLTYGPIGNAGNSGYSGTDLYNMPAITKAGKIFGDGVVPAANEVALHPGNSGPTNMIARWNSGETGLVRVVGSIQNNLPFGDGIGFQVQVDGVTQYSAAANGSTANFDFYATVAPGSKIDLVTAPNSNFNTDESRLTTSITGNPNIVASLGHDYVAGTNGQTSSAVGISDLRGTGSWNYYESDNVNLAATANEQLLVFGAVGNIGTQGYGGGELGVNLPAVSDSRLFGDGEFPLAHELAVHPSATSYTVMRWTAGADEAGLANITGDVRNLVNGGNGIDFHLLVDGVELFSASASGPTLPRTLFDVSSYINVGSTIDLVVGNNGGGDFPADETVLSAFISVTPVPEPSTCGLLLLGLSVAGGTTWRKRRRVRGGNA